MRLVTAVLLLVVTAPLMAQDPVDARGWINRGVAEFKSDHYPQAIAAFQQAVESDPSFVPGNGMDAAIYSRRRLPR